jgi:vancomycin permeability regulator SanA
MPRHRDRGHRRRSGHIPRVGRVGLLATGVGVASVSLAVSYVRSMARGHVYSVDDVPKAPVGIVFGALVYADGTPSEFLRARLDLGRRLLDRGKIGMILVTGDHAAPWHDETAAMQRYLVDHGVPDSRIVVDRFGFDTYDSVVRARDVYGVGKATMITQSYHLPRAVGTARAIGLDAAGVGDDSVRRHRIAWTKGLLRDQLACVKTLYDLASERRPTLEPPSDAVRRALAA